MEEYQTQTQVVEEYLTRPQVLDMLKMTSATLRLKVKAQEFPAPIMFGPKSARWPRSEVEEWMASRPRGKAGVL